MSLVRTLRDEIVNQNITASAVLRKAKILAASLRNDEFSAWLSAELNGYTKDGHPLPDYRIIRSPVLGHFQGFGGSSVTDFHIPVSMLPDLMREDCEKLPMGQALKELESMVETHSDQWRHTWPTEAVILARDGVRLSGGMELVEIYQRITNAMLEGVIDSVRTRFLDFLLGLQGIDAQILESEEAVNNLPAERVQNAFHINVYGDHNVIPAQSTVGDISVQTITQSDFQSLTNYLRNLGVSPDDTNELRTAIETDGNPEHGKLGSGVAKWIGGMVTKSISGAWTSSVGVASKVLTDALFRYYGWK